MIELIMQISGSATVMLAITTLFWVFKSPTNFCAISKIFAVSLVLYATMHLYIHTTSPVSITIAHLLLDDSFIMLACLTNIFTGKNQWKLSR